VIREEKTMQFKVKTNKEKAIAVAGVGIVLISMAYAWGKYTYIAKEEHKQKYIQECVDAKLVTERDKSESVQKFFESSAKIKCMESYRNWYD
jgi:hypothetical protein